MRKQLLLATLFTALVVNAADASEEDLKRELELLKKRIEVLEKKLSEKDGKETAVAREVEETVLLGGVQENILFYNPLEGTVRPQSRLLWRVIREVMSDEWI